MRTVAMLSVLPACAAAAGGCRRRPRLQGQHLVTLVARAARHVAAAARRPAAAPPAPRPSSSASSASFVRTYVIGQTSRVMSSVAVTSCIARSPRRRRAGAARGAALAVGRAAHAHRARPRSVRPVEYVQGGLATRGRRRALEPLQHQQRLQRAHQPRHGAEHPRLRAGGHRVRRGRLLVQAAQARPARAPRASPAPASAAPRRRPAARPWPPPRPTGRTSSPCRRWRPPPRHAARNRAAALRSSTRSASVSTHRAGKARRSPAAARLHLGPAHVRGAVPQLAVEVRHVHPIRVHERQLPHTRLRRAPARPDNPVRPRPPPAPAPKPLVPRERPSPSPRPPSTCAAKSCPSRDVTNIFQPRSVPSD